MNAPRRLSRLFHILLLAAICMMTCGTALAQNTLDDAVSLSKSAMEDYDFIELESADNKLIQAVKIIEDLGITDPSVASIYVAQGIVSYGRFKDSAPAIADERAFSAFLKALTLNRAAAIPGDYRSDEIVAIFDRAKETIASAPSPASVTLAAVKPSIQHAGKSVSERCSPIEIRAAVPAHPDIYRVYLNYARSDQRGYTTVEMEPTIESSDILTATIPGYETQGDNIQYYLEAQNRLGEPVASVAGAKTPLTTEMTGSCVGLSREDLEQTLGDPTFQLNILAGTGFGIVSGQLAQLHKSSDTQGSWPATVNTGIALLPFHMRFGLLFNLPAHLQFGVYVRGQLVNLVPKLSNNPDVKNNTPERFNVQVGITLRYLVLHAQPYRLYIGVEAGWGGANASVSLGNPYNKVDMYLYDGPAHIAPEIGFLWSFHKNVGLAVELAIPIYFPKKPSAHFDLSVGPYFQF